MFTANPAITASALLSSLGGDIGNKPRYFWPVPAPGKPAPKS